MLGRLKDFRRIATRYDKLAQKLPGSRNLGHHRQLVDQLSLDPEDASKQLRTLLGIEDPAGDAKPVKDQHKKPLDRVARILDAVATSAVRVGLTHPVFDSNSVEDMPFRRGPTVITDTYRLCARRLSRRQIGPVCD